MKIRFKTNLKVPKKDGLNFEIFSENAKVEFPDDNIPEWVKTELENADTLEIIGEVKEPEVKEPEVKEPEVKEPEVKESKKTLKSKKLLKKEK